MSIAKMNKVTIIGTKDKEEEILKKIMKYGFVQIEDSTHLTEDEEFKEIFKKQENGEEISKINQKLTKIENAIKTIHEYNKIKKPMFAEKNEYKDISAKTAEEVYQDVDEINEAGDRIKEEKAKIEEINETQKELEPWKTFTISADLKNINYIKMIFGTFKIKYNKEQLEQDLNHEKVEYSINNINKDKNNIYVCVTTKSENANQVKRILKKYDFEEKNIILEDETVEEKIEKNQKEIVNLEKEIEQNLKTINPKKLEILESLYDYYLIQKEIKTVQKNIVTTNNTFYLEGWMPRGCKIETNKEFIVKQREAEDGEDAPVLLQNNKIVEPFESITNMYSVPNGREIDPNPVMSIFFIIFFGMMLSDAGYGIILTLACAFMIKKKKFKKGEGSLFKMLFFGGISTIIWGLLFGSFFGDLIKIKAVINPLVDVMPLMGLSLLFGIIHIYVGMFIQAIKLVKDHKPLDAIFDIGFWYLLLTGVFLLIIPMIAGDIGIWSQVGKYLAIVGLIGLLLTQGRREKGIIKKAFKGVSSLYSITSYFADVLSYSRIMALCLSTGVIAQVVNLLGQIAGPIPALIIGLLGHGVNLANSALGSYVHTSRLQYVEFFGKFYEGGGREFTPLKVNNKYTKIKEEF